MKTRFFILKIILYTFIFTGIFNSSHSKVLEFNYDAKSISNYFAGLIYFDDLDYISSEKAFKKLDNFEEKSTKYSSKLIHSLVNLGKYNEAYKYAKKLEKKNIPNFESNLFLGLYEFKAKKYIKAQSYFDKLENNFQHQLVFDILKTSLNSWTEIGKSTNKEKIKLFEMSHPGNSNINLIQKVFAHCHIGSIYTEDNFRKIIQNNQSNFSRYNFFFAKGYD